MFSNYTLKQPSSGNLNQCGGYALAALIHVHKSDRTNQPVGSEIYKKIIAHQANIGLGKGVDLFAPANVQGARSLPSCLINVAKEFSFTEYKLTVTKEYGERLPALIAFEKGRLDLDKVKITEDSVKTLDQLLKKDGYYLALVDDGNHWIAVVRKEERTCFYNPGDGKSGLYDAKIASIFSGVVIRLN